ncbi:MAG: ROK family protein [Ginsengibacter sp.]
MVLLGIDLGGTKLALALFDQKGKILYKESHHLGTRKGAQVGELIVQCFLKIRDSKIYGDINSIGISVPGIYRIKTGTVWAPNIQGWDDYALLNEITSYTGGIPVTIDSDRACYILGEVWHGNAKRCKDAIFLAVGTGIGAGILIGGHVLRGAHDIAGAIGWMALERPFKNEYSDCGCLENYTSGEGIAKTARALLNVTKGYTGYLNAKPIAKINSHDVFAAFDKNDPVAVKVIRWCIEFWGMAAANLVSLFNPEKIIFGGGVFGPAIPLIPQIKKEAAKWAQPISIHQVTFQSSSLGSDAGVYGAGYLALKNIHP